MNEIEKEILRKFFERGEKIIMSDEFRTTKLHCKGSNVHPAPPVKIELHKRSYDELSEVLIEKVLEIEILYQKMHDNFKHSSCWCKKGDCKNCEYMRYKNDKTSNSVKNRDDGNSHAVFCFDTKQTV